MRAMGQGAVIVEEAGGEGRCRPVADMSTYGQQADRCAELATGRWGEDKQAEASGEGLAAIAYALLEVASAIRDHTASQE
jgi:hypothetical protein